MVTCKDCVHVDVCCSYISTAYNKCELATPDFKLLKNVECDECQHFKGRSRFVELPCLPGDKVFYFDTDERIYVQTVESLIYGLTKTGFVINSEVDFISDLLGERFFLSYEEAERALKERENNAN